MIEQLPALIPVSLLIFALLGLMAALWRASVGYVVCLTGAGVAFLASMAGLLHVATVGEIRYEMGGWAPPIGIEYVMDTMGAYMTAIILSIGLLAMIYAPRTLRREVPSKELYIYPTTLLLLAGLVGMALTGDVFNLYVFIEIASLAAYALLGIGHRRAPLAVFRYLLIGAVGGGFYLLGVAFLYYSVGTLNMADLMERLPEIYEQRSVMWAAILMTMGLGLKAALFPMHYWMPDVYTYGPSASTALIAPVMTKVYAFVLLRIYRDVFTFDYVAGVIPLADIVAWLAAVGIIYASVVAIAQTDFRRMLAYSSVGQIGYIALGIGLANPFGIIGALLHMVNHAFMKACLFLIAGALRERGKEMDMPTFVGMARERPWTAAAFWLAVLAMVGIPPTAGFFSKWYLLLGTVDAGAWVFFAVIIASSLLSAVYFFRVAEMAIAEKGDQTPSLAGAMGGRGEAEPPPPGPWAGRWLPAAEPALAGAMASGAGESGHHAAAGGSGAAGGGHAAAHGGPDDHGEPVVPGVPHRGDHPADKWPELPASLFWPIAVTAALTVILGLVNMVIVTWVLDPAVAMLGGR